MPALLESASHNGSDSVRPQCYQPGIFVRFEFGVAFSPTRSRGLAFEYASSREAASVGGRCEDWTRSRGRDRWLQNDRHRRRLRSQSALQLGRGSMMPLPTEYVVRPYPSLVQQEGPSQQSTSFPGHRDHAIREYYAPGTSFDRWQSLSSGGSFPESYQRSQYYSLSEQRPHLEAQLPHHYASLPVPSRLAIPQSLRYGSTSAPPTPLRNKPLPPLPSAYRLGEDNLPWSSPTWYPPPDPVRLEPVILEPPRGRPQAEDPQRMRNLEALQEALLSVDSMEADWWDSGSSTDSQDDLEQRSITPQGLGWAVRVDREESSEAEREYSRHSLGDGSVSPLSPPPSYMTSEWERQRQWHRGSYYGHMDLRRWSSR